MKTFKIVIITICACALTLITIGLIGSSFNVKGIFDFSSNKRTLSSISETNEVTAISILTYTDDINYVRATDNKLKISYYDNEKQLYKYEYKDGKASLVYNQEYKFNLFDWNFNKDDYDDITVYVPSTVLDIEAHITTGDIDLNTLTFNLNSFKVIGTTSDLEINDVNIKNVNIELSTGETSVEKLLSETFTLKATTGEVEISRSSINNLVVEVSTGDVSIENVITDTLDIVGTTSEVEIEELTSNKTNIKTSTGKVYLRMNDTASNNKIYLKSSTGDLTLKGANLDIASRKSLQWGEGSKEINVTTKTGDIRISFK